MKIEDTNEYKMMPDRPSREISIYKFFGSVRGLVAAILIGAAAVGAQAIAHKFDSSAKQVLPKKTDSGVAKEEKR